MRISLIILAIFILAIQSPNYAQSNPWPFLKDYEFFSDDMFSVVSFDPENLTRTTPFETGGSVDIRSIFLIKNKAYVCISDNKASRGLSMSLLIFSQNFKLLNRIDHLPESADKISYDVHYGLTNNSYEIQGPEGVEHYFAVFELKPSANVIPVVKVSDSFPWNWIFLRDNHTLIYLTRDLILWKFDIQTQKKEKLYKFENENLSLEGVAYHHPWIICNDSQSIYIFDYEKKELKLIKKFEEPGFPAIVKKIDGRAELVSGGSWLEDDKGFFFGKQNNSILNFFSIFSPLVFRRPEVYYYDLETHQEYFVSPWYGEQWRKKIAR